MSYGTLTLTAQTGTGEVGQAILYTATVLDASGSPVNPATLTLTLSGAATLTVPIGSWTTGSTGVFTYTYLPTVGGVLAANATATVPSAADDVTTEVGNSSGVTLADIKARLNITGSADDAELQQVLNAAIGLAEDIIGPIFPRQITERVYDDLTSAVALKGWPILSVQSVSLPEAQISYSADTSSNYYYTLSPGGTLTLFPSYGFAGGYIPNYTGFGWVAPVSTAWGAYRTVEVVYTVGRTSLSDRARLAIAEIVRHLWKPQSGSRMSSQQEPEYAPSRKQILAEATLLFGNDTIPPGIG